jgi:hypothetical protein
MTKVRNSFERNFINQVIFFFLKRNLVGFDALVAHSQEIWDLEFIFWLLWTRFHFAAATFLFHSSRAEQHIRSGFASLLQPK